MLDLGAALEAVQSPSQKPLWSSPPVDLQVDMPLCVGGAKPYLFVKVLVGVGHAPQRYGPSRLWPTCKARTAVTLGNSCELMELNSCSAPPFLVPEEGQET